MLGVPERIDLERIDRLWVFPPRVAAGRERGLVVASLVPDPGEPHPLLNIRYETVVGIRAPRPAVEIEEVGRAPGPTVAHVVRAAAARLAEPEEPVELGIGGDPARWRSELTRLGIVPVDPPCGE